MKWIAALAIFVATPAVAGTPLWQNVEEGMTIAQVQALYPAARLRRDRLDIEGYRPLPACPSTVQVMFGQGRVHAIQIRGAIGFMSDCPADIELALKSRYGDPVDRDFEYPTILSAAERHLIWVHDGVAMRLRVLGERRWRVEYVSVERLERERQERARIGL